ncbi:C-3 sterol dehydrogenase/C-4 decarboxylase family protein [Aspergillus arachidicola]|uniref:C-3 sterol dehydrogenase/C-4 decarboxylase family protein n=1 Tax=Aspergillus arachidicola TaxID=656916 RepID=A0A2G7GA30_9EURO|nr:C-3 sterol dehydrogenase/C-4 decarboxylase family protein [Aspergillus arachidicola]
MKEELKIQELGLLNYILDLESKKRAQLAYHIIAKIPEEEPDCSIRSIDVNIDRNRHSNSNVHYHHGDLACVEDVQRIMQIARPVTIFHTASPEFSDAPEGNAHIASPTAEDAIQAANRNGGRDDQGILTCAIRPSLAFGERDVGSLGKMFAVARQGKTRFQIGNGQNPYNFIYVGNLADAHLLAAHALLNAWGKPPPTDASTRVDGECFHLNNEDPWLFWDFQRAVSALAGNPIRPEDIVVIPKWVGLTLGFVNEWVAWIISGGTRPANMAREGIRFSTLIRTLNGNKAKRVLGYRPKVGMQEGLERSVRWFMENAEGEV